MFSLISTFEHANIYCLDCLNDLCMHAKQTASRHVCTLNLITPKHQGTSMIQRPRLLATFQHQISIQ